MLQAKVLRAVEQGEVQPLGSNEPPDRVDVRLICATNRDLEAMAKTGAFRDDLFYRLSVMTLELPPLRSYKDNLEVLANVFLEQSATSHGKQTPRLGPDVLARLQAYDFPGNVRELKNTIEHAVILCTGDELAVEDLPKPLPGSRAEEPRARDRAAAADARRGAREVARSTRAPVPDRPAREARRQREGRRAGRRHQHGDALSPAQAPRPAPRPHRKAG